MVHLTYAAQSFDAPQFFCFSVTSRFNRHTFGVPEFCPMINLTLLSILRSSHVILHCYPPRLPHLHTDSNLNSASDTTRQRKSIFSRQGHVSFHPDMSFRCRVPLPERLLLWAAEAFSHFMQGFLPKLILLNQVSCHSSHGKITLKEK